MLEQYAPASAIVDEGLNIVHLSSGAGRFLQLREGEPSHNVLTLARDDLRRALRMALHNAFEQGVPTTRQVRVDAGDSHARISIHVRPSRLEGAGSKFALIVFEDIADVAPTGHVDSVDPRSQSAENDLEDELRHTKEELESTSAAHDRTMAELQTVNEELLSINEEQKAASEELETGREEIQSINEELTTINQEHQSTIEELKRTNADLQNLIESTEIGTIFLDRAMRVRRFTPAICALFNFIPTDQGRPLSHITHRLKYLELMADVEGVLASLERMEREVESDTGEAYIVRINPYRSLDGGTDGVVLTFFNNTLQHRVSEELRAAKTIAESADLAKGTFLATLSHEFRTPLNGILGYAELLEIAGPLNSDQLQRVERIKAGSWHLVSLIDDILSFSRLDGGHEMVDYQPGDARVIATEAKALVEPAAAAKGLSFQLDIPDTNVELESDGGKVRQILINLCGNAVKYTTKGSIHLGVRAEAERVIFDVRDTGRGIAPEHHERIFERFWQVDGGSTRIVGGLGIGLAAAREYARLLGGDITVESALGAGSTFRVWLPRSR
jgi:two-component system CheB/CheR fusion protein